MCQASNSRRPDDFGKSETCSIRGPRHSALWRLFIAGCILQSLSTSAVLPGCAKPESGFTSHTVDRGEVLVRCVLVGTVESVNQAEIICEVEAHSYDGYRSSGAEVLWIVRDGATVKKGDVLVELNDTLLKELRDDWDVKVVQSEGKFKQADIRYRNHISRRETELADILAKLQQAELAESSFDGISNLEAQPLSTTGPGLPHGPAGAKSSAAHHRGSR